MKKSIILIFVLSIIFSGCDILDSEMMTQKTSENYPSTEEEAYESLMGVYNAFGSRTGNDEWQHPFILLELMSDDRLGGGGQNDSHAHAMSLYKLIGQDMYSSLWSTRWRAIYRANLLLSSLDNVTWKSQAYRNKIEGQALFLRAYTNFTLSSLFGPIPLITEAAPENKPRATPAELYGQIGLDLKRAIELLEPIPYNQIPKEENGLATHWAAEALMARVFLFYTGYYNDTQMGTITKSEVISWIDECANSAISGHDLLPDFRNLWPYSIKIDGKDSDYKYAKDHNLNWINEYGDNNEAIFAIKVSTASQNNNYDRRNSIVLNFGLRDNTLLPFGFGWGLGPVNPQLYDEWPDDDLRKNGSILDVRNPEEGESITKKYKWGGLMQWNETGYWQKKYIPINVLDDKNNIVAYSSILWNMPNDPQFANTQDLVLIRFADVLLMGAELGSSKAQEYLNRVRSRVNLPSVPLTLENIKKERRHELAFEGVRWLDLLRWHDVEAAINKMNGIDVTNNLSAGVYKVKYRTETEGFIPIPESEIALSEGVLTQTPGWGTNAMLQPGE